MVHSSLLANCQLQNREQLAPHSQITICIYPRLSADFVYGIKRERQSMELLSLKFLLLDRLQLQKQSEVGRNAILLALREQATNLLALLL